MKFQSRGAHKYMSDEFYTAKEARDILGMTHSALLNQVAAGHLQRIIPPGKRQGVYSKREVDNLKKEMEAWFISRKVTNTQSPEFVKATIESMPEGVSIASAVFNNHLTIPLEKRIAWLQKNPDIDYFVKQEGHIVGYLSLVPLELSTIDDLLHARRYAKDLEASDIISYIPNKLVSIYGMAIGVKPGVSLTQKRDWGAVLINGARNVIVELGRRGIEITYIKAHSATPDGIRLMRHIGFTETVANIPGMRDFSINVKESGIPFIIEYREAFKQSQAIGISPGT